MSSQAALGRPVNAMLTGGMKGLPRRSVWLPIEAMFTDWIRAIETPRRARLVAVLLRLASVVALSVGALLATYGAARPLIPAWASLGLFAGFLAVGLLAAQRLLDLARHADQHRRDGLAKEVFDAIRQGRQPRPFTLYLRPFESTDALAEPRVSPIRVGSAGLVVAEDCLEFEHEIEATLRGTAPLIALGEPLEHIGAGRIRVADNQWQPAVEALMDAASAILLLPSPRPGTLWEIDRLLRHDRLAKTLVLDPPNHGSSNPDYDPEDEWRAVQLAFAQRGLALPDDDRNGLVLRFSDGDAAPQRYPVRVDAASTVGAIVRGMLAGAPA